MDNDYKSWKTDNNAVDVIAHTIEGYVKTHIKNASFDVSLQGMVTEVLSNNNYKVKIQGTVCTVPCITGQTFKVNDNVTVLVAQNTQNRKCIIGRGF